MSHDEPPRGSDNELEGLSGLFEPLPPTETPPVNHFEADKVVSGHVTAPPATDAAASSGPTRRAPPRRNSAPMVPTTLHPTLLDTSTDDLTRTGRLNATSLPAGKGRSLLSRPASPPKLLYMPYLLD